MNDNDWNGQKRVRLSLEEDAIVTKFYTELYDLESGNVAGITVRCDDGSEEFFVCDTPDPTFADIFGIVVSDEATYDEKKRVVMAATGWSHDEEFLWLKTDQNGCAIPGTDTNETLTKWLKTKASCGSSDYEVDTLIHWISENIPDKYFPGFKILSALSESECSTLGIRQRDMGVPASSMPYVVANASIDDLNSALAAAELPFVFVDNEGAVEV